METPQELHEACWYRWKRFTDQELAVIAAALRSVGTACGAQMCGEIAHEQAVRK